MTQQRRRETSTKRTGEWLLAAMVLVLVNPLFGQTAAFQTAARAPRTVLVSIPDRKLAVLENGTVIADFAVSVGAARSPSPTGEFTIISRVAHPTYYHAGSAIPPGKENPVGTRWVGLSEKGYGIHGTNAPKSIGHAASHGCIRLRNRDMEKLFSMLRVGDVVEIRGERDAQTAKLFDGEGEREADGATAAVAEVSTETATVGSAPSI